jgi:hypothetical protein
MNVPTRNSFRSNRAARRGGRADQTFPLRCCRPTGLQQGRNPRTGLERLLQPESVANLDVTLYRLAQNARRRKFRIP